MMQFCYGRIIVEQSWILNAHGLLLQKPPISAPTQNIIMINITKEQHIISFWKIKRKKIRNSFTQKCMTAFIMQI